MTIGPMFGFEEVVDDSDLRSIGWFRTPNTTSGAGRAVGIPSINGRPGRTLKAVAVASTGSPGDGGDDVGLFSLGRTIRALWTAGGFSLNARLVLNQQKLNTFAGGTNAISGTSSYFNQFVWDGVRYWAIRTNDANTQTQLAYSTDLVTWTVATLPTDPAFPSGQIAALSISVVGVGDIIVHGGVGGSISATNNLGFRTSDAGANWTTLGAGVFNGANGGSNGGYCAGSATYPLVMGMDGSTARLYYFNGTTWLTGTGTVFGSGNWTFVKKVNGYVFAGSNPAGLFMVPATDAGITGSFASITPAGGVAYDAAYFGGRWLLATAGGIYSNTNADPSTGTWTLVAGASSGAFQFAQSGSLLVAVGPLGSMYWTTDGVTWSGSVRSHFNNSNQGNRAVRWDSTQFTLLSGLGLIATASDGLTWYPKVVRDITEGAVDTTNMFGLYCASAVNQSTGAVTLSTTAGLYVAASAVSGGNRTLSLYSATGGTAIGSAVVTNAPHYVELVATATATANTFTIQMKVDGADIGVSATVVLGTATSDTTSQAVVNLLPRNATVNAIDDLVFLSFDGTINNAPIGPHRIVPRRGATDVQAQWSKVGTAASNALSTVQVAQSVPDGNSVQSATALQKDIYGLDSTTLLTIGVRAVQVSGYLNSVLDSGVVNLGVRSSATENVGADLTVSGSTPFYATQVYERDPATNALWTPASAQAANPTLTSKSLPFSPSLSMSHMDGTTGQTTGIVDSSAAALTWVPIGTQSGGYGSLNGPAAKFGTAALRYLGSAGSWSLTSAAYDPGTGPFTLEFWFRNLTLGNNYLPVVGFQNNPGAYGGIFFCANGWIGSVASGNWQIINAGVNGSTLDGNYHHMVCQRDASSVITCYQDGAILFTGTVAGAWIGDMSALRIGSASTTGSFDVDEIRYNKQAMYSGPFTPPSGPFP